MKTTLVIDQGNTRTKMGWFHGRELVRFLSLMGPAPSVPPDAPIPPADHVLLSSVRASAAMPVLSPMPADILSYGPQLSLPIRISYATPTTLGADRIANAAAAQALFPGRDTLVVDAGTCLTLTEVRSGALTGGSISPGLRMRFRALEHFTGRLPLVDWTSAQLPEIPGRDTAASIQAGVVRGLLEEMEGMIHSSCSNLSDPIVLLTGGDAQFFEQHLKSPIFAHPHLTLVGLNEILLCNRP